MLALLLLTVMSSTPVAAHSGKQSYLYVSVFGTEVEGRVEIPTADLARVLGITIPDEREAARASIVENRAVIQEYLDEHVALSNGGAPWELAFEDTAILTTPKGAYALFPFEVAETFDTEPRGFTVAFDVIYETDPNRDNLVIIENDWQSATFNNEAVEIVGLSTGIETQRVDLEDVSAVSSLQAIRQLGSNVGRLQFELLLTMIALVVPIGLLSVAAGNRREAPSMTEMLRSGKRSLVAFVAAQAVALWAIGLGSIELSNRLTSAVAAAGLLVAAAPILFVLLRPQFGRLLPLVAVAAGGVSGVAVGSAATRLGMQRSRPVVSLLAFNVGLVLVVLAVAVVVGAVLVQLRHSQFAPTAAAIVGAVFVVLSIAWAFEQVAQRSVPIETFTNPFQALWRQIAVAAALFVVAVVLRARDRRAGHPRTVHQQA